MANVTVQACLEKWLVEKTDPDQRIAAMRTKLVALSDEATAVAIDAAIKGLSQAQQHEAYKAVMSAIIAKAGGTEPTTGLHSVVGDAVALDTGDLTSEHTEHFKQAARALNYGHYLRAMELVVPDDKRKIRQQMAGHTGDPQAALKVLVKDPLPTTLQAPSGMDGTTQYHYYTHLVDKAVGSSADTDLATAAEQMQQAHTRYSKIKDALAGDPGQLDDQVSALVPGLYLTPRDGVDYTSLYQAVLAVERDAAAAKQKGEDIARSDLSENVAYFRDFLNADSVGIAVLAARATAMATVLPKLAETYRAREAKPATMTQLANDIGASLASVSSAADTDTDHLAATLHWHTARNLAALKHGANDTAQGQQFTDVERELAKTFNRLAIRDQWDLAQEHIFQYMPKQARLTAYEALAAEATASQWQIDQPILQVRLRKQALAGALTAVALEGDNALDRRNKETALATALGGDANVGATAALFTDVPPEHHWRVMQAMVQVAQQHAGDIPDGDSALAFLQSRMGIAPEDNPVVHDKLVHTAAAVRCDVVNIEQMSSDAHPGKEQLQLFYRCLGIEGDDANLLEEWLPEHIRNYLFDEGEEDGYRPAEFQKQRATAILQEVSHLLRQGLALNLAVVQINHALATAEAEGDAKIIQSHRRLRLRETVMIAQLPPGDPLDEAPRINTAIKMAFASATGLDAEEYLTAVQLGLIGGTPEEQDKRIVEICAAAASTILAGGSVVPSFSDVVQLRRHPAVVTAQRLVSDDSLSSVRDKIDQVDDTPTSPKAAAQAILQVFGHANAAEAADALVGRMQRALGDSDDSDAMQAALHSVCDKANHCCTNAAAAQTLLTNAAAFEADGHLGSLLKSQREDWHTKAGQVFRQQPIQHKDSDLVHNAAHALAQMVAWREIAEQTLETHPWAVAQFGGDHQKLAPLAGQMLVAGVSPVVRMQDPQVNQAVLLAAARRAAEAQQMPLKALQEAVIAAEVALDTDVTKLTDAQLNLIYTKITQELSDDNTARAFINAFTLAHDGQSPFTVSDLLMVTSMPMDALATQLPSPQDDAARARQARALAAVITVERDNNTVGLQQMAALERRVAQLIQVTPEMVKALYQPFESNLGATVHVRDVVVGVLKHAPGSDALQQAAQDGRELRNTAVLDPTRDPADSAVRSALVIEAMLRAADKASTPTQAIHAMFRELYAHDTASRGKTVKLEDADAFAKRCVDYLSGKRRKAYWPLGNELREPFEGLRRDMLTVPTRGSDSDDTERLAAIREKLGSPAARLQAVQGVNGVRQIPLRHMLLRMQAELPSTVADGEILQRYLQDLFRMGVLRPEDINAMRKQYRESGTLVEAQKFIQSIIDNGWDFTTARPATSGLGFVNTDAVSPVTITSLKGKAEQAVDTISLAMGVTARIRVIQSPVLKQVIKDNAVVEKGDWVEGYGDAVIQVGKGEAGLSTGKVTLRADGGVFTHDTSMIEPMIHAMIARYPGGGNFTPTAALMASKPFLQKALQLLAEMSKAKGIKFTITVSQAGYNNLAAIKDSLHDSGITVVNAEAQNTNNSPKKSQATPTPPPPPPEQMSQQQQHRSGGSSASSIPFANSAVSTGSSPEPGHAPQN